MRMRVADMSISTTARPRLARRHGTAPTRTAPPRTALRRGTTVLALASAAGLLAGCGHASPQAGSARPAAARAVPERIVRAPKMLLAAAEPQANGIMWALAGKASTGLFEFDSASGQLAGSVSVSRSARSVAESATGVIGLALGTRHSGALELLDGHTGKLIRTVSLPAPARQVVVGSDGVTFYVLTAWAAAASVTIVNSQSGVVHGSVPVPGDTTSVVPDVPQAGLYVLQKTGLVDEIGISDGKITTKFKVGDDGRSIALNPDGNTLYVLKGTPQVSNIAVVNVSTERVRHVLPAPSYCRGLFVSASGSQLYEVVGTPGYGNIQVFAL
jgi:DNA-binding beta-propeller fold protein YncE